MFKNIDKLESWNIKKIPEILFFQEGPGVRNNQYTNEGVKLLNVANLQDGELRLETSERYISEEEAYGRYNHFLVDEGDLIIASSGIKVEYFDKKMGFATKEHLPLCMNTSTIRFKVLNNKELDIRYFSYFLKTIYFKRQIARLITGSAQLNFGPSHLSKIDVIVPPISVQEKIVEVLDKALLLVNKRREQIEALDELVKSKFIDMFGDPVTNPNGWKKDTIGGIVKSITAGWSANGEAREKRADEKAVLKVSAVTQGYFKEDEYKVIANDIEIKKYVFPEKGDLLFSRANTREMVGATCIIHKDYPDLLLPDKLWKVLFIDRVNVFYMKYILSEPSVRAEFSAKSTGTSGSMYNVSMDKFKSIEIPVPPIDLQNHFADFVKQVDKLKFEMEKSLKEHEDNFNSLMQRAFKGELFN